MMKRSTLLLAALALGCASTQDAPSTSGEKLYVGPTFLTLDDDRPTAKAIRTDKDGKILELLDEVPASEGAEIVKLPGALALPGLHDAHIHVLGIGAQTERVDLLGSESPAAARARAEAFLQANPDVQVVHGRGWDQSLWEGKAFPNKAQLEGMTDKPVLLRRVDGHAAWANQATLNLAGITRDTKDPKGGKIVKGADGEPTGVLVDAAMDLVYAKLPAPTVDDYERWLKAGLTACADAGLVAVHDMGFPVRAVEAVERLDAKWTFPVRVFLYLNGTDEAALAALKKERTFRADVELRGIKLLADGAMGSRGAALLEPYSDDAENHGLLQMSVEAMQALIKPIHEAGFQAAVHAIGDGGNRATLDAFAAVQGADTTRRHRLEHAQMIHEDDFARLKPMGVIASMQPTHATSDMRWAEARVGPERVKGTYAWRRILDLGVPLAFGSDAPVESEKVAWGLYSAVARADHEGAPEGGWRPDQKLSLAEAARAFSAGAAYAVHREATLGKLAPGYALDLSVFEKDAREEPAAWIQNRATAVVTAGRVHPRLPADG
jgi:predicted amidohydrolase YtcJ